MGSFVIERLHLRARAIADHVDNTEVFDTALFRGLVNAQCLALRDHTHREGLVGNTAPVDFGGDARFRVGDAIRDHGKRLEVHSLVVGPNDDLGIVRACLQHAESGVLYVAVSPIVVASHLSPKARLCRPAAEDSVRLWTASAAEQCTAWKFSVDTGMYTVVCP